MGENPDPRREFSTISKEPVSSQVAEPPVRQEQRLRMSYDEWLAFADEDVHGEWVDGEATIFTTATGLHQDLIGFLFRVLAWFVEERELGIIRVAPFAMRVAELAWAREPDILFVAAANRHRLADARLIGPADRAVEVVSDDSVRRDRVQKLAAYEAAGVAEYWLLDPRPGQREARFFRLDGEGRYREAPLADDGRYRSAVLPGFWLDPAWFWQEPLPEPDELKPLIIATLKDETVRSHPPATGEEDPRCH